MRHELHNVVQRVHVRPHVFEELRFHVGRQVDRRSGVLFGVGGTRSDEHKPSAKIIFFMTPRVLRYFAAL